MTTFNNLYADQYDHLYAEKDYSAECDLIEAAIAKHAEKPPATMLDIGCGTGRHALALTKRGYRVTGVDLSAAMLEIARAASKNLELGIRPEFVQGDARDFSIGRRFDAAIMMFAVIGYLSSNADVLAGLRNIRSHLEDGALFLCDFWYGPSVLAVQPSDRVKSLNAPDRQVIRATTTALDPVSHTADVAFRLWTIRAGEAVAETHELHRLRYFFPQEFALLLNQTGFALESLSAFPTLDQSLDDSTWNAFVVARAV